MRRPWGDSLEEIDNWFWEIVFIVIFGCAAIGAVLLALGIILAICTPSNW